MLSIIFHKLFKHYRVDVREMEKCQLCWSPGNKNGKSHKMTDLVLNANYCRLFYF